MPVGDELVRDAGHLVEHDNGALTLIVVPIHLGQLRLTGCPPDIQPDGTSVSVEHQRMQLHTKHRDVFIPEISAPQDPAGIAERCKDFTAAAVVSSSGSVLLGAFCSGKFL